MIQNQRELMLHKGGHTFIFRYEPGEEGVMVETLAAKADAGEYRFDWLDAAILTVQVTTGKGKIVVGEVE